MDYRKKLIESMSEEDLARRQRAAERINNPDARGKMFRNAYALKLGLNYGTLVPFCENLIMATEGAADHIDVTREKLEEAFKDYDPEKDVLVVVGRSFDNLLVGMIASAKVMRLPKSRQSFYIAVYFNFSYKFYEVFLDPSIPAREIYAR